jgi:hypothetical protein
VGEREIREEEDIRDAGREREKKQRRSVGEREKSKKVKNIILITYKILRESIMGRFWIEDKKVVLFPTFKENN